MTANPKLALDQKSLGNQGAFIDDSALLGLSPIQVRVTKPPPSQA